MIVFSVLPLLNGLYLGFTDSRAGLNQTTHFTGLANYTQAAGTTRCSGSPSGSA